MKSIKEKHFQGINSQNILFLLFWLWFHLAFCFKRLINGFSIIFFLIYFQTSWTFYFFLFLLSPVFINVSNIFPNFRNSIRNNWQNKTSIILNSRACGCWHNELNSREMVEQLIYAAGKRNAHSIVDNFKPHMILK